MTVQNAKQNFIQAFCLLNKKMFADKISVSNLTKVAGYDRTTFYQYFSDMQDLKTTVEHEFTNLIKEQRSKMNIDSHNFINFMVNIYEENALYFDALLGEYGDMDYIDRIAENIELDLIEMQLDDENPYKKYLINFHITTTINLFHLWLKNNKDLPIEELMLLNKKLYMDGVNAFQK